MLVRKVLHISPQILHISPQILPGGSAEPKVWWVSGLAQTAVGVFSRFLAINSTLPERPGPTMHRSRLSGQDNEQNLVFARRRRQPHARWPCPRPRTRAAVGAYRVIYRLIEDGSVVPRPRAGSSIEPTSTGTGNPLPQAQARAQQSLKDIVVPKPPSASQRQRQRHRPRARHRTSHWPHPADNAAPH